MTWTYAGAPGTDTAAARRDAVRLLTGDADTTAQQVTDEEITFALAAARDGVYGAASLICRSLAAKYARQVSTSVDGASQSFGEKQRHYAELAAAYAVMAKEGVAGILPAGYDGLVSERGADDIEAQFSIGMNDRPGTTGDYLDELSDP